MTQEVFLTNLWVPPISCYVHYITIVFSLQMQFVNELNNWYWYSQLKQIICYKSSPGYRFKTKKKTTKNNLNTVFWKNTYFSWKIWRFAFSFALICATHSCLNCRWFGHPYQLKKTVRYTKSYILHMTMSSIYQ